MKLKDFETPFEEPPAMMELCVLADEPLPVVCVGCTRDKSNRSKKMAIINPSWVGSESVLAAKTRLRTRSSRLVQTRSWSASQTWPHSSPQTAYHAQNQAALKRLCLRPRQTRASTRQTL